MLQTLSGRTPKPPDRFVYFCLFTLLVFLYLFTFICLLYRYQEEDTKEDSKPSKKEKGVNNAERGKQRHKSSSNTVVINRYGVKNEDSSDDEITFASNSKSQACRFYLQLLSPP